MWFSDKADSLDKQQDLWYYFFKGSEEMIFYTADLHFGHQNVLKYDNRPFADVNEMDRALIELWNGRVSDDDEVYIVGDFAFKNEKPEEWYLQQLKGKKHLIIGNHDAKTLSNPAAMAYFESVDKMKHISDGNHQICLCHFPIAEWNGYFKGHFHIYAHIHNRKDETYQFMRHYSRALNAGCMINGYMPVPFDELVKNNLLHYNKTELDKLLKRPKQE